MLVGSALPAAVVLCPRRAVLVAWLVWLLSLAACAPTQFDDPFLVMIDREAAIAHRRAAFGYARDHHATDARRIEALHLVLWSDTQPPSLRLEALRQLVAFDEFGFQAVAAERMVRVNDWDVVQAIIDTAVRRQWRGFTPTLIRNWARPSQRYHDADRPERRAISSLNPGVEVEQTLWATLGASSLQATAPEQAAAWIVLSRLLDRDERLAMLTSLPAHNQWVSDLQAAWSELAILPALREGLLWLEHLRQVEQRSVWDAAAATVAVLSAEQRQGLALRHIPVLAAAGEHNDVRRTRGQLLDALQRRLRGAEHHDRGDDADAPRQVSQRLIDHADQLVWADLFVLHRLLDALAQRSVVVDLFDQAEVDRRDETSEHGGVLMIDARTHDAQEQRPRYEALAFEPMYAGGDHRFVPTAEMIRQLYTGLAHYHFHAQQYDNAAFAGPGVGDLRVADNLPATFVVFTFVDRDRLNVDYYLADRIVIDLGTLRR